MVQFTSRLTQAQFLFAYVDRSVQLQHLTTLFCFVVNTSSLVGLKAVIEICLVFPRRFLLDLTTSTNGCSGDEEIVSGVVLFFCFFFGRSGDGGGADEEEAAKNLRRAAETASAWIQISRSVLVSSIGRIC